MFPIVACDATHAYNGGIARRKGVRAADEK
jgi:hypothetical protein